MNEILVNHDEYCAGPYIYCKICTAPQPSPSITFTDEINIFIAFPSFHIEFLRPFFFKILATTLVLDRNLTFCFVLLAVMCNFFFFGILGSCRTRKARLWDCFEIRVGEPDSKLHCHLRLCVYVCAPRASCDGEGCLCAYSCLQNQVSGKISTCCAISKAHSVKRFVKLHCYSILNAKYHDIVPWWYPSCVLHAFKEK